MWINYGRKLVIVFGRLFGLCSWSSRSFAVNQCPAWKFDSYFQTVLASASNIFFLANLDARGKRSTMVSVRRACRDGQILNFLYFSDTCQFLIFFAIITLTLAQRELLPQNVLEALELRLWNYTSLTRCWLKLFEFHVIKSNFQKQHVSKFIKCSWCDHAANLQPA